MLKRRGGVVSELDARPEGRAFESRPIRDARLCSWAKHFTTNCPRLLGWDTKNRRSLLPGVYARGRKRPHSGYINVTCSGLTHYSISWHRLWASCAHQRLRSAALHDTIIGAAIRNTEYS